MGAHLRFNIGGDIQLFRCNDQVVVLDGLLFLVPFQILVPLLAVERNVIELDSMLYKRWKYSTLSNFVRLIVGQSSFRGAEGVDFARTHSTIR